MKTVNFKIEDDINQRLKIIAAINTCTVEAVMITALQAYADKHCSEAALKRMGE